MCGVEYFGGLRSWLHGRYLYWRRCSHHHLGMLRLSDPHVLEATQGQTVQEGRQGSCRHEERTDAYQRHEREGGLTYDHLSGA